MCNNNSKKNNNWVNKKKNHYKNNNWVNKKKNSFNKFYNNKKSSWKNYNQNPSKIIKQFNLYLFIKQTYNNIFLTVTNSDGQVKFVISGGRSKLKGNNRNSHRSVQIITQILISKLRFLKIKRTPFQTLCVFLTTPKNSVISLLLNLINQITKIRYIAARYKIPHNGLRSKKLKRL